MVAGDLQLGNKKGHGLNHLATFLGGGSHVFFSAPFPELRSILWQCFRSTRSRRWAAFVRRNMARQAPKASKSCCFWLKLEAILRVSSQRVWGCHPAASIQRKKQKVWCLKKGELVRKNPWEFYIKNIGNVTVRAVFSDLFTCFICYFYINIWGEDWASNGFSFPLKIPN